MIPGIVLFKALKRIRGKARAQFGPELGARLAANALEGFKQNYTWDHRVQRIVAFLAAHRIHLDESL